MTIKRRAARRHARELPPMTEEELRAYLDAETRKHMGMSGDEFIERWRRRELPDTAAVFDLGMIAHFLEPDREPSTETAADNGTMVTKERTKRRRPSEPPPLTAEDVRAIIDTQARKHLGISGDEFLERWRRKELPYSPVAFDLGILAAGLDASEAASSST